MENVRATSRPAFWLMVSIMLVALNLRLSMAAVGPLLSAIRGDIPLSFSLASLLTMLPVMAMGLAMFFGLSVSQWLGEQCTVMVSLLIIGLATVSRLFLDSAAELILSAVLAGVGIAMIQALMPALIMAGFCGLILCPQHPSLLWSCLLGLGIGGLFPMSLIVSLDHLDDPQRAGGLTAFVQDIGYLIAGVMALMLLMVLRFNPRHYARHIH
jgi:cyanate permease